MLFMEASAKTGVCVEDVRILQEIYNFLDFYTVGRRNLLESQRRLD